MCLESLWDLSLLLHAFKKALLFFGVKLSKLFPPKKQSGSRPLLTHITLGVLFGVVSFGRAHEVFESHMPMPTMQFIVHLIILQLMALGPHR